MNKKLIVLTATLTAAAFCVRAQDDAVLKATAEAAAAFSEAPKTEAPDAELQELGEGSSLFYLEVGFADGSTASYAIHSDAETVGAALRS